MNQNIKITSNGVTVEQIIANKTSDGKLFENPKEAIEHQASLDRASKIREWTIRFCYNEMTPYDIANALIEHGKVLGI